MAQTQKKLDIINGITPLENAPEPTHPRLFFTPMKVARLRRRMAEQPWASFLERLRRHLAHGEHCALAGAVYLLTDEREAQAQGIRELEKLTAASEPQRFYHLSDTALLYDWLYATLPETLRAQARDFLERHGRKSYEEMALRRNYHSGLYTCNMMVEQLCEITTAGCALYGETPDMGPWLRFVMEKAKTTVSALGSDGASQEGICYGGFYIESLLRTLALVEELLGWDLQRNVPFFEQTPAFFLYSVLPSQHIGAAPDVAVPSRNVHMFFGDGVNYPWYGPGFFLRRIASLYHNEQAQWLADLLERKNACANGVGNFLNLIWHDPLIRPKKPSKLPTFHHFADKDIVIMRSGWDGREAVFGFKCGPHSGHFALRNYPQNIGGGHMAADAGSMQLFAHGDWLLREGGYCRKTTAGRNTILVNGIGQTGDTGGTGDWFECTELRREKRGPAIVYAAHHKRCDYVIGNVAPAYEKTAGLKRFLRHVFYLKPDIWVIADELQTIAPSRFELFFHACENEHAAADRPFKPVGERQWVTGGKNGSLRLTALGSMPLTGFAEVQHIKGIGAHHDRQMAVLRVCNNSPKRAAVFITVLEAFPTRRAPLVAATLKKQNNAWLVTLQSGKKLFSLAFKPGQPDLAAPALFLR